ncbi:MAG TPA: hydrogenase [Rubrivivax sp.]|nr:hydrogenase [Rubrivivax sp.]
MSAIPMPVQAGADILTAYPLVEQMFSRHGCTEVKADRIDAFLARPGHALLVFTEDPMRFKETLDLAVIVPQLQQAFPGRFAVGVLLPEAARQVQRRYGFNRWPALVMLKDGQYVGAIDGLRNWDEYLDQMQALLSAAPSRPPTVGIPVRGPGGAAGTCAA